jgi:hypothetical protein
MRLAWHIIRKDLRRLRWILLLWAIVLAASLALASIQSALDAESYYPFWVMANIVGRGFLPFFAFGLVMGLLHDDPVAEIDAFWITRPIAGGELLLAKTLALLLISLVPIVVTLPFWLAHDFGASQLGLAVRETWVGHFIIVAVALPVALVSANGSKFVMNVMFGAGGLLLLILCLQLGASRRPVEVAGLVQSQAWLIAWLWLAASAVVAWIQFFRRRLRWSLVAMAVALAGGLLIVLTWSRPLELLRKDPSIAAVAPPRGTLTLMVRIDGAIRPAAIVGQVPLRDGAAASHGGVTLKVRSVFVDFTGELQMSFSETALQSARGLAGRLPGAAPRPPDPAHFLLFNPADGVILPVQAVQAGTELEMAAMRFRHAGIRLRPDNAWQGTPPADLKAWLQNAWLVKVLATGPALVAGGSSR